MVPRVGHACKNVVQQYGCEVSVSSCTNSAPRHRAMRACVRACVRVCVGDDDGVVIVFTCSLLHSFPFTSLSRLLYSDLGFRSH